MMNIKANPKIKAGAQASNTFLFQKLRQRRQPFFADHSISFPSHSEVKLIEFSACLLVISFFVCNINYFFFWLIKWNLRLAVGKKWELAKKPVLNCSSNAYFAKQSKYLRCAAMQRHAAAPSSTREDIIRFSIYVSVTTIKILSDYISQSSFES